MYITFNCICHNMKDLLDWIALSIFRVGNSFEIIRFLKHKTKKQEGGYVGAMMSLVNFKLYLIVLYYLSDMADKSIWHGVVGGWWMP